MSDNNGGECEDYIWYQTNEEVTCEIKVSQLYQQEIHIDSNIDEIKRNSINVDIDSENIVIFVNKLCIFSKEFNSTINHQSTTWYLEKSSKNPKNKILIIIAEKRKKGWWSSCFKGDFEIDLSKIISTRNFNDCDERTQTEIRKIIQERNNADRNDSLKKNVSDIISSECNIESSPLQKIR